jgi:L-threonate 2-dehydrogenase
MNEQTQKIGFVGLGAMGLPMAHALIEAGYTVVGYDISENSLTKFASMGGQTATSVQEAARDVDVLISMVVNDSQTEDVLFGSGNAVDVLKAGSIVISGSTVPPAFSTDMASRLAERNIHMIDCPVSGGVAGAEKRTLTMMAAGPSEIFGQVEIIIRTMGSNTFHLGEECGQGSAMKVVNQLLCGVHIAVAGEAVAFAKKSGLDVNTVYDVIGTSAAQSWMFMDRVAHMENPPEQARSAVDIFIKDLGMVTDAGRSMRVMTPVAAAALQMFIAASGAGYGREDDSQIIKAYERD